MCNVKNACANKGVYFGVGLSWLFSTKSKNDYNVPDWHSAGFSFISSSSWAPLVKNNGYSRPQVIGRIKLSSRRRYEGPIVSESGIPQNQNAPKARESKEETSQHKVFVQSKVNSQSALTWRWGWQANKDQVRHIISNQTWRESHRDNAVGAFQVKKNLGMKQEVSRNWHHNISQN